MLSSGAGTAIGILGSMLGALLSPIGLVIAGVGALAAYLITSTDVGGQALGWLGDKFNLLKETALAAWKGIGDALAAGDIGLAAKILWLTLKLQWQKGVNALNQVWVQVKDFFLATWTEAVFGAAKIATNAWAGLQAAWTETVDFLRDSWSLFTTFIAKNWNRVVGFLKKAWQKLKSLVTGKESGDVQKRIDSETQRMNRALDERRNSDIFEREQRRKSRLSEIEGQRTGTLDVLDASTFARKLLECGRAVVISIPYRWPAGSCSEHVHDQMGKPKLREWLGREPVESEVVDSRLVSVHRP